MVPTDARTFVHRPSESALRFGGRTVAAIVLFILTIVVLGIAMTLSWWNITATSGGSDAFYLGNVCSGGRCDSYQGFPGLQDVFGLTNDLILAGLALSIVALACFVLAIFWPRLGVATLGVSLIGAVIALAGPAYLYVALPGALSTFAGAPTAVSSFFGSYTSPGGIFTGPVTYTWGGGAGWYAALIAFVLFLGSTVIAFSAIRNLRYLGSFRQPRPSEVETAAQSPMVPIQTWPSPAPRERFCPVCGSRYPAGTQFCSKDAAALKEVAD